MSENQISNEPHLPPPTSDARRKKPFILFSIIQWVIAAFFGLVALVMTVDVSKLGVPGAPVALFWVALGTTAVVAMGLSPPAFFRLPRMGKIGVYVAAFVGFVISVIYVGQMNEAYSKTPQGAKEAAVQAAADRQAAEEKALIARADAIASDAEKRVADVKAAEQRTAEYGRKLEKCFSFFGHGIPKLTTHVKDALENPRSFEYIRTERLENTSSESPYNVELFFRAENGFSAIRTASVRANINPDDCSITDVSDIYN